MKKCSYGLAWVGNCGKPVVKDGFCEDHIGLDCCSCGEQATHECEETGQFVCGFPLCDNCVHTIAKDGTNGGIGYNASSLPKGYKPHCRKEDQFYQPWFAKNTN
jgi:hypothetical protein